MDEDLKKAVRYLKQQIETAKEEILERIEDLETPNIDDDEDDFQEPEDDFDDEEDFTPTVGDELPEPPKPKNQQAGKVKITKPKVVAKKKQEEIDDGDF